MIVSYLKKRFRLDPPQKKPLLKFLLGLAFLFVDGGELRRAHVLVDRLVDCLALVVVHSLVLGGTNLINTLEKSIMFWFW